MRSSGWRRSVAIKPEDAPEIRCGSTHQAEEDEPDDEEEVEASAAGIVDGRIPSPRGRRRRRSWKKRLLQRRGGRFDF